MTSAIWTAVTEETTEEADIVGMVVEEIGSVTVIGIEDIGTLRAKIMVPNKGAAWVLPMINSNQSSILGLPMTRHYQNLVPMAAQN